MDLAIREQVIGEQLSLGCGRDSGALPALGLAALYLQIEELDSGSQRPLGVDGF